VPHEKEFQDGRDQTVESFTDREGNEITSAPDLETACRVLTGFLSSYAMKSDGSIEGFVDVDKE
jgi:hypothetical protein